MALNKANITWSCKQIAKMVGLSRQATASVLNDAPVCLVSPEKKARILELARELHYVRNNAARTLARGKSGIIGILTGGLHIRKNHLSPGYLNNDPIQVIDLMLDDLRRPSGILLPVLVPAAVPEFNFDILIPDCLPNTLLR